jgi:hypothetical protein
MIKATINSNEWPSNIVSDYKLLYNNCMIKATINSNEWPSNIVYMLIMNRYSSTYYIAFESKDDADSYLDRINKSQDYQSYVYNYGSFNVSNKIEEMSITASNGYLQYQDYDLSTYDKEAQTIFKNGNYSPAQRYLAPSGEYV